MELQWSRGEVQKERTGKRRADMKRRGPRMALGKVRRRGLCRPPPARIVVLFFIFIFIVISFFAI